MQPGTPAGTPFIKAESRAQDFLQYKYIVYLPTLHVETQIHSRLAFIK